MVPQNVYSRKNQPETVFTGEYLERGNYSNSNQKQGFFDAVLTPFKVFLYGLVGIILMTIWNAIQSDNVFVYNAILRTFIAVIFLSLLLLAAVFNLIYEERIKPSIKKQNNVSAIDFEENDSESEEGQDFEYFNGLKYKEKLQSAWFRKYVVKTYHQILNNDDFSFNQLARITLNGEGGRYTADLKQLLQEEGINL